MSTRSTIIARPAALRVIIACCGLLGLLALQSCGPPRPFVPGPGHLVPAPGHLPH